MILFYFSTSFSSSNDTIMTSVSCSSSDDEAEGRVECDLQYTKREICSREPLPALTPAPTPLIFFLPHHLLKQNHPIGLMRFGSILAAAFVAEDTAMEEAAKEARAAKGLRGGRCLPFPAPAPAPLDCRHGTQLLLLMDCCCCRCPSPCLV